MSSKRGQKAGEYLRENWVALGVALVLAVLLGVGIRTVRVSREAPAGKKVLTITGVIVRPETPPAPKPPPQPKELPREELHPKIVEVKATDIPPPDAGKPQAQVNEPVAGPLALAAEATGEGDAFNLAGNPGGRSLLGPGRIGDGTGDGVGSEEGSNRFGWYYAQMAQDLAEAFRKMKRTSAASTRVAMRVWADSVGRISRVELIRSTGDPEVDAALQSVVGLRLHEPPPSDIPMPMIARFTARKPE